MRDVRAVQVNNNNDNFCCYYYYCVQLPQRFVRVCEPEPIVKERPQRNQKPTKRPIQQYRPLFFMTFLSAIAFWVSPRAR